MLTGAPRAVMASDPATVSLNAGAPTLRGEIVAASDPRVRIRGGTVTAGANGEAGFEIVHSATYNAAPVTYMASNDSFEFQLTGNSFEWISYGLGQGTNWSVEIDGVATNDVGYPSPGTGDGATWYMRVDLPPANGPRRIRIVTPGRSFGGLVLAAGASIAAAPVAAPSSIVFLGDSITDGTGASATWKSFAAQAGYRLGIDNVIISGVGGSGYVAHVTDRTPGYPDFTFGQRPNDVLAAVNGGPPDMVVVAGGVNDAGYSPDDVGQAALAYFQALRAGAPNMIIVVVSPWCDYDLYTAQRAATRDAVFEAAKEVGGIYLIDVTNWVTTANRDIVFNGYTNGPHPTDAGHALYGQLVAQNVAAIIGYQ